MASNSRSDSPPEVRSETGWLRAGQGRPAAAVLAIAIGLLWFLQDYLPERVVRNAGFDVYQQLFPRERGGQQHVIVVGIDDESLSLYGQWPWRRNILSALIERIASARPAAIGLDMVFPEQDRYSPLHLYEQLQAPRPGRLPLELSYPPDYDSAFARTLGETGAVVGLAGIEGGDHGLPSDVGYSPPIRQNNGSVRIASLLPHFSGALRNAEVLDRSVARHGSINRIEEDDGLARRVPSLVSIGDRVVASMPLALLLVASGMPVVDVELTPDRIESVRAGGWRIPTDEAGEWWVHYTRDTFPMVSAVSIMDGTLEPETLHRRIVLIGMTAPGIGDRIVTPLGDRAGVVVHAEALENALQQRVLRRPRESRWIEAAALGVLALVAVITVPLLSPTVSVMSFLVTAAAITMGGCAAFWTQCWLIDVANPLLGGSVVLGTQLLMSLGRVDRERQQWEKKVARLDGELDVARRIQWGMLPKPVRVVGADRRLDLEALMRPARHVSGDLYDFFWLDPDHTRLFFMVGDVSGKGLPASLFMALSKALIKSAALDAGRDPGVGLTVAGRVIALENPESLFVSIAACVLDLDSGELAWCCAGHENPYLFRARDKTIQRLDTRGGPALCMVEDFDYPTDRIRLAPGDVILLVTDGLTEAHNRAGDPFGSDRVSEALLTTATHGATSRGIIERLRKDVEGFTRGEEAEDDLTILVLRWKGPAPP